MRPNRCGRLSAYANIQRIPQSPGELRTTVEVAVYQNRALAHAHKIKPRQLGRTSRSAACGGQRAALGARSPAHACGEGQRQATTHRQPCVPPMSPPLLPERLASETTHVTYSVTASQPHPLAYCSQY